MTTRKMSMLSQAIALSICLIASAHAGGIYKWVDADGVVHFGEKPPRSAESESVNLKGLAPSSDAAAAQKRLNEIRAAAKSATPADPAAQAAKEEEARKTIARNCEVYRNNLDTMRNNPRVKETLPNGEMAFLGDDEKSKRMAETEKLIAKHCKDVPAP